MDEPVAWMYKKKDGTQVITDDPDYKDGSWIPLYTTPPQREWQGLSDEEVMNMHDYLAQTWSTYALVRHVEAKLKGKNT